MESTTRAALGTSASLGDLYDARRDDFCGESIFTKSIPDSAVTLRDTPFSDIRFLHSDDYSSKFKKLGVSAEMQVSVLGGLFKLDGSGQYLSDQKESARAVKSSLIYNIKTQEESLNIHHKDLKDAFAIDAIQTGAATHVVVGISWGANSILTYQYENKENSSAKGVSGNSPISALGKKLSLSISGKAAVDYKDDDSLTGLNVDVRIFADFVASNEKLRITPKAALELMKKLPSLVSASNNGKGKPLSYRLLPIGTLKGSLGFTLQANVIIKSLEEAIIIRVVQLFDQIAEAKQKMFDFHQDVTEFRSCISSEDYQSVMELKGRIEIEEAKLRSNLGITLKEVRSGNGGAQKIEDLLHIFQQSDMSPQKVDVILEKWTSLRAKIDFARTLFQNGVKYIGNGVSLAAVMVNMCDKKCYILYFSESSEINDPERWQGNMELFLRAVNKKQDDHAFIAVDCDIHPEMINGNKTSFLKIINNGVVESEDWLKDEQFLRRSPMVHATTRAIKILSKPNKRVPLAIPCVGDTCDPSAVYEWICTKCEKPAEYGFDKLMYCSCGKYPISDLEFRCPVPRHGNTYLRHDTEHLENLLGTLRTFKEMNILILGETGVGKSTWINNFANFMHSETLEEAEEVDVVCTIPTKFTIVDQDYEEVVVKVGDNDKDESHEIGESATQVSKAYSFIMGDTVVRLIDTPGIGDTRGVEQDKKNFENIMETLSYYDEIHGICILLKPNNRILSVSFQFCLSELLTHLHKDAANNIVFCFTNCRTTTYKPGDTLPVLKRFLSEKKVDIALSKETIYCFDSESFRFLAAIKNNPPVSFSEDEQKDNSASWKRSREETTRMLEHFIPLTPHVVQSMVNLNFLRKLIRKLTRPLAEITLTMENNKILVNKEIEATRQLEEKIDLLSQQKMIKRVGLQATRISHPKTVCTDPSCVDMYQMAGQSQLAAFYKKICHERCHVEGIDEDVIGHAKLSQCQAMNTGGVCTNCSHRYNVHAHVYYDSSLVEIEVEDKSIADSMNKNKSAAETKRKMIKKKQEELAEYESELKMIEAASIRFTFFLKENSITYINDSMEGYLELFIKQEKARLLTDVGRKPDILKGLELSLESYRQERQILEQGMVNRTAGERPPTQADITELVEALKNLKHTGKALEDALNAIHHSRKVIYNEVVPKLTPQLKKRTNDKQSWSEWVRGVGKKVTAPLYSKTKNLKD